MRSGRDSLLGGRVDTELQVAQSRKLCAPGMGIGDVYFRGEHAFGIVGLGKDFALWIDDHRVAVVDRGSWGGIGAAAIAHEHEGLIFDGAGQAESAAMMLASGGPASAQCKDGGSGHGSAKEFGESEVVADRGADSGIVPGVGG